MNQYLSRLSTIPLRRIGVLLCVLSITIGVVLFPMVGVVAMFVAVVIACIIITWLERVYDKNNWIK